MESRHTRKFIIAEVAQAHDGSLGLAHSFIDALASTGVDAIKFQTHIADAESSEFEPFRVQFSYQDKSRFEYWKRMEFTEDQWIGLKQHCDKLNVEFISSPFSVAAVELLEKIGVRRYKIGSGEVNNLLMLDRIGRTGKPIILSSGMSSFSELKSSIDFLKPFGVQISILQCTTAYPTQPEQWGLEQITKLEEEFKLPVGFSDHSGNIFACLAAATLGACILEFHAVFDKRMFGPDTPASLTIDQIHQLTKGIRDIELALSNPVQKNEIGSYTEVKRIFGKSLSLNKPLKKGSIIKISDLETRKPADKGIHASLFREVIGRKLNKDLPAQSFLNYLDLI